MVRFSFSFSLSSFQEQSPRLGSSSLFFDLAPSFLAAAEGGIDATSSSSFVEETKVTWADLLFFPFSPFFFLPLLRRVVRSYSNACGLYVQTHGRMRPLSVLGSRKKADSKKASSASASVAAAGGASDEVSPFFSFPRSVFFVGLGLGELGWAGLGRGSKRTEGERAARRRLERNLPREEREIRSSHGDRFLG